jgi:hypothetical protein
MPSYHVYRDCPGRPRQYIRRVSAHWAVWHPDVTLAQRFSQRDAERWAQLMHRRTRPDANAHPQVLEPAGRYSPGQYPPDDGGRT